MTPAAALSDLLEELSRSGARLRLADGGRLEVTAPRAGISPALRERIAAHKSQLLAWLSAAAENARPVAETGLAPITPDPAHRLEPFPLSDLQASFLIGSREGFELHVRPHQYMEIVFERFETGRFSAALNRALARQHGNLAVVRQDLRLEIVPDPAPVVLRIEDRRGAPEEQARAAVLRVRAEMERAELPLDRWPWLDVRATLHGTDSAVVHLNSNNFFCDAAATGRLVFDTLQCYEDPAKRLDPPELGYRDCVLALAAAEESESGRRSRAYWQARLADLPDAPAVPTVAGEAAAAGRGARSHLSRRELVLDANAWAAIRSRAAARGLSATNTLLAVYAEVLAAWSGSRHFLINNMITHRVQLDPRAATVLGNFASLYPLEVDWREPGPFLDRALRLQQRVLEDLRHLEWSGVKVLQELNRIRRTPGRAVCPFAVGSALFVGSADRPDYSVLETPQVLIDCEFWEQRDGSLWIVWDVVEELFPDGLIGDMLGGFARALGQLAAGPEAWQAAALDLIAADDLAERTAVNAAAAAELAQSAELQQSADLPPSAELPQSDDLPKSADPPQSAGLLHDALAERARREPDRVAVVAADRELGYGELHRRALHLAALLRDRGVLPGCLVAVVLPKGWRQAVAVHGILESGCAYVPVDPAWPETRVARLLESSGAVGAVTDAEHYGWLGAVADLPVFDVDNADGTAGGLEPVPGPRRAPTDPAYVIFTSGSTGEPKGAELDHRGPLGTIADVNRRFGIGPRDVLFGVSSLCFDLSVYDFFGSVHAGATLVLPPGGATDPAAWAAALAEHGVTVWNSVPAVMRLVVEAARADGLSLPALRTVLLSGDWIPLDLPDQIRALAPNARVVSLGGATEASIWSVFHPIARVEPGWASIPYGRPLAGQSWHVLDESGRDCPRWTPGHLHIGGTGVALGYLNDADRTAAAFPAHPRTGERLYRTGDLGRYLPGGEIEFLGRADDQVKIQGFRVEPGEVEHALLDHPGVRAAAVIARAAGGRAKQLAGFAVGHRGTAAPEPDELRAFLAARLPAHLVPTRIAVLDELPLTGNGKLDRRRLEAFDAPAERPAAARERTEPDTPNERALARIWREVLECGPVGAHDDFFDLGGQSFAALRVSARIAAETGRHVPLGVLLERRTVRGLGAWLDAPDPDWSPLVRLGPATDAADADDGIDAAGDAAGPAPWFLVHPAGGGVLCYRELAAAVGAGAGGLWALQAPGPAAGRPALDKMEDFVELYLNALIKVRPCGPYRLAGWSSGAAIAFALAEELERRGESVERLVCVDSPAPGHAPDADERTLERWFVEDLVGGRAQAPVGAQEPALEPAEPADRTARLAALLAAAGPDGSSLDPSAAGAAYEVFRGVLAACAGQRPGRISPLITLLRAAEGQVSEFAGHPAEHDPAWGWGALTEAGATVQALPGTHYTLLTEPAVRQVAAVLSAAGPGTRTERTSDASRHPAR